MHQKTSSTDDDAIIIPCSFVAIATESFTWTDLFAIRFMSQFNLI